MSEPGYDPVKLAKDIEHIVVRGLARKYYRVARATRFYGGSAAADCVGCNLRCAFCWSGVPRDKPNEVGRFYEPEEVYEALARTAEKHHFRYVRVSGNEPTIGWQHLIRLLELFEQDGRFIFILETNGILIGADRSKARELAKFTILHVRVSLKGCNEKQFHRLTGAKPSAFKLQIQALKNLSDYNVPHHPAVMATFCSRESLLQLATRLASEVGPWETANLELETLILYPHVERRLKEARLWPPGPISE
ncbi:Radical SAM domain protein [Pyrolobus fumarii 1A]|uniref:Radical SAM domain protein n=1 Tax=Pyrolobus fumarii (strain DSM 11204 / 1A) TaxID=694429 RepID=G0EDE3_PYRF1|nr:Radical SAM domain protein [Pyrolobus fumarii 1A]